MSHLFQRLAAKSAAVEDSRALWESRAEAIYAGCHVKQASVIDSIKAGYHYLSFRCPRRSGKSFGATSLALWFGETLPGSRILIISLTLKSTRENYWSGAPGGIFRQNHDYKLCLRFNHTDSVWWHENGSRGRLAGAETRADIEYLRGAAAEADICIIDEGASFSPDLLAELIRDVIEPGLMTRNGFLVICGTPGSIPLGTFFEATAEHARIEGDTAEESIPSCIPAGLEDAPAYAKMSAEDKLDTWRLHTWTLEDNVSAPGQWRRALRNKKRWGWADDHPTWRREYLGEWVTDATDLVYGWAQARAAGKPVTWYPDPDAITPQNPAGLPLDRGPWHFVMGIDLGYNDESAFVLAAYSESHKELRHVYDFKKAEMLVDDLTEEILSIIDRFGVPEAIVADTGGSGAKTLIESINARHGIGIIPAQKTDKPAFQELINSDFHAARIKIIPGTDLAHEISGLQWDLSRNSKLILARTGALKEDPRCPNHLCDALLYLHRYAHHYFSEAPAPRAEVGSSSWLRELERAQRERVAARKRGAAKDPHGLRAFARSSRNAWDSIN